jgi:hypothetical protein
MTIFTVKEQFPIPVNKIAIYYISWCQSSWIFFVTNSSEVLSLILWTILDAKRQFDSREVVAYLNKNG